MKITQAENGFVVTKENGDLFVYKTLREAADDLEGPVSISRREAATIANAVYAPGYYVRNLEIVRHAAMSGRKIDAIKELRACFVPKLGLKETKEIIEQLVLR